MGWLACGPGRHCLDQLLTNARGRREGGDEHSTPVGLGDAFTARASFACLRPQEVHIPIPMGCTTERLTGRAPIKWSARCAVSLTPALKLSGPPAWLLGVLGSENKAPSLPGVHLFSTLNGIQMEQGCWSANQQAPPIQAANGLPQIITFRLGCCRSCSNAQKTCRPALPAFNPDVGCNLHDTYPRTRSQPSDPLLFTSECAVTVSPGALPAGHGLPSYLV